MFGRSEVFSLVKPLLMWIMAKRLSFGQIDGVWSRPCVIPFSLCMHSLCQKKSRWWICGKT